MSKKPSSTSIITSLNKLAQLLDLKFTTIENNEYPLKAPYDFITKITKDNNNDPLLQQILPQNSETEIITGYCADPLKDKEHSPIHGLVHKYPNRVLLLTTNDCVINCRFCFRRFCKDYIKNWAEVFAYINANNKITEVILSGGDPLILADNKLATIINKLSSIAHIKYLRLHSRIPIVYPERITLKLIITLSSSRFKPTIITHCNHPNEIDNNVINAISLLKKAKITLYNQSVLLKNINDNAQTLIALSEKLFAAGIQPYYIHLLDKVIGAQRFYVDVITAKKILKQMLLELPGYLVPKLVYQDPDLSVKTLID